VEVGGYQSLRRVKLELGLFTVITGPTGSGKSAVIRAIRLVAFNARGAAYVSRGEPAAAVALYSGDEGWAAVISRGRVRGKDKYRLVLQPGSPESAPDVRDFTKLAGTVPEPAAEVLGLSELNFAAQFDRPFLLSETAGDVAKVLGRLTNVSLLFEAAREAAKRKGRLSTELRMRQDELAYLEEERERFATLPARRAKVGLAEEALGRAQDAASRVVSLSRCISVVEGAQARLEAARAAVPEPPDISKLTGLAERRGRLRQLLAEAEAAAQEVRAWRHTLRSSKESQALAVAELEALLIKAGRCPTCGQAVHA
jgi:DNA repair protein SbcC/Rad50